METTFNVQAAAIARTLLTDKPIAFHPIVAKVTGDVKAALFFCQLLYWSDKGDDQRGWIWKTQKQWTAETAMTRREQETARGKLRALDLVEEARRGAPPKLYFRIKWERLFSLIKPHTSMAESAILECLNPPEQDGGNSHFDMAESAISSSENTPENTQRDIHTPPWLQEARSIDGWVERGAPHEGSFTKWGADKDPERLFRAATSVKNMNAKTRLTKTNLASVVQQHYNKHYGERNNGTPSNNGHKSDRLERIRKAKNV